MVFSVIDFVPKISVVEMPHSEGLDAFCSLLLFEKSDDTNNQQSNIRYTSRYYQPLAFATLSFRAIAAITRVVDYFIVVIAATPDDAPLQNNPAR